MTAATRPDRLVHSGDGTSIAVFEDGPPDGPPVVLVHGATADHTTFRVVGPILAGRFRLHAIDRRGRGASGDGPAYAIEREFEDVAAVATAIATERGRPVDVVGHSYGGRVALGAALRSDAVRRVVCYEGAPAPPGSSYHDKTVEAALRERAAADDREGLLELFMRDVVGMPEAELAAFRADPVWSVRAEAAPTILREIAAERDPAASLDALSRVAVPVLQVLGGDSRDMFRRATEALDRRLPDGRVVRIPGARHAAHHTHPDAFVAAVTDFLLG